MQRFQVPQFIEVEDKLFGPLTLKQFIYIIGGAAIVFILWVSLPFVLVVMLGVPVMGFSLGLAFYTINGDPVITVLSHGVQYLSRSRLYLWRKKERPPKKTIQNIMKQKGPQGLTLPRARQGTLRDLSWSLDVQKKLKEERGIPQAFELRGKK